jgi:hypothetical protein
MWRTSRDGPPTGTAFLAFVTDAWVPVWLDGSMVACCSVSSRDSSDKAPGYFIEVTLADGRLTAVRDFSATASPSP